MKTIANIIVTGRAVAAFQREMDLYPLGTHEVIALHFMSSFTKADGTTVGAFIPGYTIDHVADRDFGDHWLMAQLPNGTPFRFMPKFEWSADQTYMVDRASAYTFSIGLR